MAHPFFKDLSWSLLRHMEPPFKAVPSSARRSVDSSSSYNDSMSSPPASGRNSHAANLPAAIQEYDEY